MNELLKMFASESVKGKGRVASRSFNNLALAALIFFGNEMRRDMQDMKKHACECRERAQTSTATNTFALK